MNFALDEAPRKRAWEYYKEADRLFASRVNFFLVAESFLVLSFVETYRKDYEAALDNIRLAIGILGLVYSFSWLLVNVRLHWRLERLQHWVRDRDAIYATYLNSVRDFFAFPCCRGFGSGIFLAWLLPLATTGFWTCLLSRCMARTFGLCPHCVFWACVFSILLLAVLALGPAHGRRRD